MYKISGKRRFGRSTVDFSTICDTQEQFAKMLVEVVLLAVEGDAKDVKIEKLDEDDGSREHSLELVRHF